MENDNVLNIDDAVNAVMENLVAEAEKLGFNIKASNIIFDDSRAYGLYIPGSLINENVNKFGAWRDYLGGGIRGAIENSSIYAHDEQVKKLAILFENALIDIESIINEEADDYHILM